MVTILGVLVLYFFNGKLFCERTVQPEKIPINQCRPNKVFTDHCTKQTRSPVLNVKANSKS